MSLADELEKLRQLHQDGVLSADEFAKAKAGLLDRGPDSSTWLGDGLDARQWAMLLHLSQLAGYLVPLGGFVVPILIWQIKMKDLPSLDAHGKIVANWLLSALIYSVVAVPLCFILVGVPLLMILMALGIIFPIIGGVKANSGETWPYPMSIKFFK